MFFAETTKMDFRFFSFTGFEPVSLQFQHVSVTKKKTEQVLALWGDEPEESDFFVPWSRTGWADVDVDVVFFFGGDTHDLLIWTLQGMVLKRSFHSFLSKMEIIGVPVNVVGVFKSSLTVLGSKKMIL